MYLSLPERVQARPFPSVEVVDMREELQTGNRSILSHRLQTALKQMKAEGKPGTPLLSIVGGTAVLFPAAAVAW